MKMAAKEGIRGRNQAGRKAIILDLLKTQNRSRIAELSELLDVSVVTVRNDLQVLENEGLVKRVHGGAILANKSQFSKDFEERKMFKAFEKQKIAKAAADLVNDGDSLIINVGSTCAYVCEELKNKRNLIVITNALHILNEFSDCANITTYYLGGLFNTDMQITLGNSVNEQLMRYRVDKLIMGMDGVAPDGGLTSYNHVEDAIMRQMIEQSQYRILVADDSKIGKTTFARIAEIKDFQVLITNYAEQNAPLLEQIRQEGLSVITV